MNINYESQQQKIIEFKVYYFLKFKYRREMGLKYLKDIDVISNILNDDCECLLEYIWL